MIYLEYDKSNKMITGIHYMPFDEVNGLGKTREELLKTGVLVDNIPEIQCPPNKKAILKYDDIKNEIIHEFVDIPLTVEQVNEVQDEQIVITMSALDEMFMMIEPMLAQTATTLKGGDDNMVNFYALMIKMGLKTIDQVPARYREAVQAKLNK